MIKAILFDMVGVLVFKKTDYVAQTQDEKNAEDIESLFNHIDDEKLYMDIRREFGLDNDEIVRASKLIPEKYEKFEDLWKILPELKAKYKLAVINNGNSIALKYWKEKFNFDIFNLFINSAQEKIRKPDPRIFMLTCARLNVLPKECLFMDDDPKNIKTAEKLGMQTIWWNKEENKSDLLKKFQKTISPL